MDRNIRVLSRNVAPSVVGDGPPSSGIPNQQQTTRRLGLITGQPMPGYPLPPPIFGLPDRSATSGDDTDDWFSRWIKPLTQQCHCGAARSFLPLHLIHRSERVIVHPEDSDRKSL